MEEEQKYFIDDLEMKLNLVNYDWGDSFGSIHNIEHRKYVDYYENGEKQSEEKKKAMFEEIERRSLHNIWTVVSYAGTAMTKDMCYQLEHELQVFGCSEIYLGELRLNDYGKEFLRTGKEQMICE